MTNVQFVLIAKNNPPLHTYFTWILSKNKRKVEKKKKEFMLINLSLIPDFFPVTYVLPPKKKRDSTFKTIVTSTTYVK